MHEQFQSEFNSLFELISKHLNERSKLKSNNYLSTIKLQNLLRISLTKYLCFST